jgi:hypothetical protein
VIFEERVEIPYFRSLAPWREIFNMGSSTTSPCLTLHHGFGNHRQMSKKEKQPRPDRPLPLQWEFGPDIPTYDFIKDYRLDKPWGVQDAVEDFIHKMEKDDFLAWEAVMAEEQGLPLTKKQQAALGELIDFSDGGDNRVLYIDDIPRPNEPWHAILNKIVPRLLIEPFRTADFRYEVQSEGWRNLAECLAEHGDGLSLPQGASSPWEVVPIGLRHKFWLQDCFNALSGLGQDEELTLENDDQQYRIDEFIAAMREHRDSAQFFNLTLDSLMERVLLPDKDKTIFVRMMQERLGIKSTAEQIADYLDRTEQGLLSGNERSEQEEQGLLLENERAEQEQRRLLLEQESLERERREAQAKEQSLRRQLAEKQSQQESASKKIGRNDPCPCGSGKKFKKCCIRKQDLLD